MKIFVNARFLSQPISGVQRYAIECSRQIKKLHSEVTFVAPHNILHTDIADELEVQAMGRNKGHVWEQIDLPLFLAGKKSPPLLNLANTAPLFYKRNYVTIHDLAFYHHPEWNSRKFATWYNILIPRVAFNARHLFTVSETIKKELINTYHLPEAKISVTYNGISENMMAKVPPDVSSKEKIILAVGTFNVRKNHHRLIEAYVKSDISGEYQLIVIGDRNSIFRDAGIDEEVVKSNNIKIIQSLNEADLADMYRRSEIVASLSLYEGFGIPVLEGLYNNCKVLCSDIPVYRELYDGVVTYCDPASIQNISNSLNFISSNDTTSRQKINEKLAKFNYQTSARTILHAIFSQS